MNSASDHAHTHAQYWAAQWQQRDHFVLLVTEFGEGHEVLAAWARWRADPQRCTRLQVIAMAARPPQRSELLTRHADGPHADLACELAGAWPAMTDNLHRLVFDDGGFELLLLPGEALDRLPDWVAQVDGYLGTARPDESPPGVRPDRLGKALARLAAPGAMLLSHGAEAALQQGLLTAGFLRSAAQEPTWHYSPRFQPRRAPSTRRMPSTSPADRQVLVLGAGLAGCSASAALARQGWQVSLIDRHGGAAREASGNPGGLFHSVVHAQDGHHARFSRACALETTRLLRQWPGAADWAPATGLLRLETTLPDAAAMQAMLDRLQLPAAHVRALGPAQASALAGVPLSRPAWHYPGGGWLQPAALAEHWLTEAGSRCQFIAGVAVQSLRHQDGQWQVLDAEGRLIASAPCLVMANANDAGRLLRAARSAALPLDWPVSTTRGQLSVLPEAARHGLVLPRLPVAGAGYLLPAVDGAAVFGATSQADDDDPLVRLSDHQANLARLTELGPAWARALDTVPVDALQGRTQWRCSSRDRLPLIGAVPAAWLDGEDTGWDQPRFVPRAPGLFMFTALGSRGITWAALGAEVLAAWITGSVMPLEADLVDATDPARYLTRAHRRAAARQAGA